MGAGARRPRATVLPCGEDWALSSHSLMDGRQGSRPRQWLSGTLCTCSPAIRTTPGAPAYHPWEAAPLPGPSPPPLCPVSLSPRSSGHSALLYRWNLATHESQATKSLLYTFVAQTASGRSPQGGWTRALCGCQSSPEPSCAVTTVHDSVLGSSSPWTHGWTRAPGTGATCKGTRGAYSKVCRRQNPGRALGRPQRPHPPCVRHAF